ncbi:hypothetical protein L1987_29816 [Smallanthus sonchifolius]|uniref:Uncharacterized protein n=1 Tax=Smallanthus sonchifolius TaxID=185202 RepID=A0ACB9I108_9ASTR|nr:hypothetical protein L1987_29816 [Smallanthus sonchifolius]
MLCAVVVSVNYRLAPEHRYPVQHNDCFDVLKFLDDDENMSKSLPQNANISRCFLVGDSAGGNIAHHVAQRACEFKFKQLKATTATIQSSTLAVDVSKMEFPATIVVVRGFDLLRDWQKRYYEWLKKSGKEAYLVEYPNMWHGFYGSQELPESKQLISQVKDFIHKEVAR